MTIPNKLTLSRLILTPVFCACFALMETQSSLKVLYAILVLVLYAGMEITDALDGIIARKKDLITDLGKVFDPFSDCFMHVSFFALFVKFGYISIIPFFVILWREFLINFVRMLLAKQSVMLPANIFGKSKTVFYALLSFAVIMFSVSNVFAEYKDKLVAQMQMIFNYMSYIAALLSVISFVIYFVHVKKSGALSKLSK